MKLEKKDIAEALGLKYIGEDGDREYYYHVFLFEGNRILVPDSYSMERAWEEAADTVLEPLIEFISKSL